MTSGKTPPDVDFRAALLALGIDYSNGFHNLVFNKEHMEITMDRVKRMSNSASGTSSRSESSSNNTEEIFQAALTFFNHQPVGKFLPASFITSILRT